MNMYERLYIHEWIYNAGAVAMLQLDSQQEIKVNANRLDVPMEWIEQLPQRLFDYLIESYSRAQNTLEWLQKTMNYARKNVDEKDKKQQTAFKMSIDRFKNTLKDSLAKVKKYFEEEAIEAERLEKESLEALKDKNFELLEHLMREIQILLEKKEVDEKITLNYVKAVILAPASGQVSFLNVTKNTATRQEQQQIFYTDFVEPVLIELRLRTWIEQQDEEQLLSFLRESEYIIAKEWRKAHKKATVIDFEWFEQYPKCTALPNHWGTLSFEEKIFMPLASTSLNDRWFGHKDHIQVISPLARLLLFLSPLGCTRYRKKTANSEEMVFAFLHVEGDCEESLQRNRAFSKIMHNENSLIEALRGTHEKQQQIEKARREVTVLIEWFTESKAKKTLLEYRWIEERFYKYVLNKNYISQVYPMEFREAIVQQHLRNYDTKMLIQEELYEQLKKDTGRNTWGVYQCLRIRELMMGGSTVEQQQSLTDRMYATGHALRLSLTSNDVSNSGQNEYKASNSKKLDASIYRILNAAKSGNRTLFFELVIRLNILAGRKISKEFAQCLDREVVNDAKFATMSLAFVAGLMAVQTKEEEKKDGENN